MLIFFILGLLLGAVAVIFALQNTTIATVTFFSWQITSSMAIILLLSIISGILICLLILLPGSIQTALQFRALRKKTAKLEEELRKQKELTLFAKHNIPSPEVIEEIEQGAVTIIS